MITTILGALAIGITLGLLGSGGSILTVPVLVYLLGHDGKVAIAESLAIVGGIALIGTIPYARRSLVDWRNVVLFGIPGMVGTYGGAWSSHFVSEAFQLALFALVMLLAAGMMFRCSGNKSLEEQDKHVHPRWQILLEGFAVGILTGLVGVGGGFLVVPALAILGGLPMRLAVGTSLVIIGLKSLSGFYKYLGVLAESNEHVNFSTIAIFLAVGAVGTLLGSYWSARIAQQQLKRGFAIFLVVMGIFVLWQEAPKLTGGPAETVANQDATESPR